MLDYRSAGSIEAVEAYLTRNVVLSGDQASPERVQGGSVTPDLFLLLGVQPYLGRAADELAAMATRLATSYPETNRGFGVRVVPIRADAAATAAILMAAVGFVLLIMCANLANLMLVRGASQQRELAGRGALGDGTFRLAWIALGDRRVGFKTVESVRWLRVVGIVPDVHYEEIGEETENRG